MDYFDILPNEILEEILLYCDYVSGRGINKRCKFMKDRYELATLNIFKVNVNHLIDLVINNKDKTVRWIQINSDDNCVIMEKCYNHFYGDNKNVIINEIGIQKCEEVIIKTIKNGCQEKFYPSKFLMRYAIIGHPLSKNINFNERVYSRTKSYYNQMVKDEKISALINYYRYLNKISNDEEQKLSSSDDISGYSYSGSSLSSESSENSLSNDSDK